MRSLISLEKWRGARDAQRLVPAAMQFKAKVASEAAADCAGCMFRNQYSDVCLEAAATASRAGLPDCDDRDTTTGRTHIYVPVEINTRQIPLLEIAEQP